MDSSTWTSHCGVVIWSETSLAKLASCALMQTNHRIPVIVMNESENPVDQLAVAILSDLPRWLVPSKPSHLLLHTQFNGFTGLLGYIPRNNRLKSSIARWLANQGPTPAIMHIGREGLNDLRFELLIDLPHDLSERYGALAA